MGKLMCGCVIADSRNTPSVRKGFGVSGYVKKFCAEHSKRNMPTKRININTKEVK